MGIKQDAEILVAKMYKLHNVRYDGRWTCSCGHKYSSMSVSEDVKQHHLEQAVILAWTEGQPEEPEMTSPTECDSCHETFDADVHYLLKPYREICPNCDAVMRPTDRERV